MEIFNKIVDYVSENPLYAMIAGAALVFIILLAIIISAAKKRKKKKLEKAKQLAATKPTATLTVAQPTTVQKAKTAKPAKAPAPVKATEPAKAPAPVKTTEPAKAPAPVKAEEPAKAPAPVKATEPAKAPAPVKATEPAKIAEPVKAPEPVKETKTVKTTKKATPPIIEEPPVEEPIEEVAVAKPVTTTAVSTLHDELKDAETDDTFYEEDVAEQEARYKGKWVICRVVTDDKSEEELYFFELHASNGEKLLTSEEYTSYNGALRGIQTHKNNILKGNFRITVSKRGEYIFKLLSGKNMLLCLGESYATKARCESAIASTKRFAETAIIDENVQYQVVKVPVEDDTPIEPLKDGCKGKWVIDCTDSPEGEKIYTFELFANNGERLLSSEEYTTYIGAVNGIQTHKANIDKGNFRIVLTKRGDYIYKLLNSNGQLLCLGEHYKNKRLCQNAVESVKRFALSSPILTSPKIKN